MASTNAAGLRCMYIWVVVRSLWPASSWIAFAVAPRIARCEQKVCLSRWTPDSVNPDFRAALWTSPRTTFCVNGFPSSRHTTRAPRRCVWALRALVSRLVNGILRDRPPFGTVT
jgi:hypothetical protein